MSDSGQSDFIRMLVVRCAAAISGHTEELTRLDQAIGDGDHGLNMARGFAALEQEQEQLAGLEFGAALKKAGMTLVMKIGGAAGPLYGSALMAMGKVSDARPADVAAAAALMRAGVAAVEARGKFKAGAKTMLDVMAAVADTLDEGGSIEQVRAAAAGAVAATRDMKATKGRAAFLGERSVGHIDPGSRSCELLVNAVCDVLQGR